MDIISTIHLQAAVIVHAKVGTTSSIQLAPYATQIVHSAKIQARHALVVRLDIF